MSALGNQRLSAGAPKALAGRRYERSPPTEPKIHAHNCGLQRTVHVTVAANANGWTCHVRVDEDGLLVTEHTVAVTKADKERLAPRSSIEALVTRSFEFLLEREPPTSILRTFALSDIDRYFPDYPTALGL